MAKPAFAPILEYLRRIAIDPRIRTAPDHDLLQHFIDTRDDAVFEVVVRRHGPMVIDVCRSVLANEADVEDAFTLR